MCRAALRRASVLSFTLLAACEIEKVGIPRTETQLALHGVLSASAGSQVVLLERTRNGSVYPLMPSFELDSPLGSDAGIAESGAFIQLVTPSGATLIAREDAVGRGDGTGSGIYRFNLPGSSLERGGSYRLSVRAADGSQLGAETSVPAGVAAMAPGRRTFDRASDSMIVEWPATPGARSYFVRIETPFGPRAFFTDSTRVRLAGSLRNVDVTELPRVFIPGFSQAVTVSAVDSNYYDWYRSHNDALSGTGLVNRMTGGLGVFGALVRLRYEELEVVSPQVEPVAGTFDLVTSDADRTTLLYTQLVLYVESAAARGDQPDALSGRYARNDLFENPGCPVCGLLGTARDGRVELYLLRAWSAKDTTEWFTGEIRGDTIVGSYRRAGGIARFVRRR
jgi:hypothetical protein